ncbi:MAG: metal ABC transporter ATP-binding protein [Treponema sp.]|nr:metal ABC transporter ATP-binding protein [Treponema sp.]
MTLINVENITVNYGSFCALKNVSLKINVGDYVCIVGANGSGKTTLVKTILGLIPFASGKIEKNFTSCGYLPQHSAIKKDFPASVFEVVLSATVAHHKFWKPFFTKKDKENAILQMQKLEIANIAKKSFAELSGGQQQRVLLARSLCAADNLLILDEPVTGLDPIVTDELYSIIRKLNRQENLAVLMVSHDIHRAVQNASHILHLQKESLFFGTVADYKQTELFTRMSSVESCTTHYCMHCGPDCISSHIINKENFAQKTEDCVHCNLERNA